LIRPEPKMNDTNDITIRKHTAELAPWFKTLNEEWLIRFFAIEPIDEYVLSHPDKIVAEGGQILYAIAGDQVVGCVALKHHGDGIYELTKMAVTQRIQARGIGTVLMQHCILEFAHLGGKQLYLESHSSLAPAIKLYERFGFVRQAHPFESEYQRSDYYMRYLPEAENKPA
jgi:putative acetyltransferase